MDSMRFCARSVLLPLAHEGREREADLRFRFLEEVRAVVDRFSAHGGVAMAARVPGVFSMLELSSSAKGPAAAGLVAPMVMFKIY